MAGRRRFVSVTSTFNDKRAIVTKINPGIEKMRTVAGGVALVVLVVFAIVDSFVFLEWEILASDNVLFPVGER